MEIVPNVAELCTALASALEAAAWRSPEECREPLRSMASSARRYVWAFPRDAYALLRRLGDEPLDRHMVAVLENLRGPDYGISPPTEPRWLREGCRCMYYALRRLREALPERKEETRRLARQWVAGHWERRGLAWAFAARANADADTLSTLEGLAGWRGDDEAKRLQAAVAEWVLREPIRGYAE